MSEAKTKRTRVNVIHDATWEMCKGLPNVELTSDYEVKSAVLRDILFNAAIAHRDWKFRINRAARFDIVANEETLGHVEIEYSRRAGEYIPHLYADRLPASRRGRHVYTHKDAAAVLRKIREHVYPKTDAEYMSAHINNATSGLNNRKYWTIREMHAVTEKLQEAALAFALDPMFKEQFVKYEATHGAAAKRDTATALEAFVAHEERQALLSDMHVKAGDTYAIAARTERGWYVKYKGEIAKYAEDDLPDWLSNVNVLKMVNADVALPNVGIKIDDKTFVCAVAEV